MIDVYKIANDIINLDGVDNIQTYRSDINLSINGLSFVIWNPTYSGTDIYTFTQNTKLENIGICCETKYNVYVSLTRS